MPAVKNKEYLQPHRDLGMHKHDTINLLDKCSNWRTNRPDEPTSFLHSDARGTAYQLRHNPNGAVICKLEINSVGVDLPLVSNIAFVPHSVN